MQNNDKIKQHEKLKFRLKIVGFIMIAAGIALTITGFVDFFKAMANPENGIPKLFFLLFIGLPMLGVGAGFLVFAFRREIVTYTKNESVPVINEASAEISPAIQNVVKAANTENGVRCVCGTINDADAKFCKACGKPLAKICENCGETNSADSTYCSNCGNRL